MPVSTSSASLNRFPGLKLLGFALWRSGVLYAQQNIASVTNHLTAPVFVFTAAVPSANYTFDSELGSTTFGVMTAKTVNGFTLNITDINGSAKNLPDLGYVAVYG